MRYGQGNTALKRVAELGVWNWIFYAVGRSFHRTIHTFWLASKTHLNNDESSTFCFSQKARKSEEVSEFKSRTPSRKASAAHNSKMETFHNHVDSGIYQPSHDSIICILSGKVDIVQACECELRDGLLHVLLKTSGSGGDLF